MNSVYQQYQSQKIKEVILYILNRTGGIGYFRLMKIMFCAERKNLIEWGTPITNLDYYARKHGPVPIAIHNGLLSLRNGRESEFSDIVTVKGNFKVHPTRDYNMEYLSVADIESLDCAIAELRGKTRNEIEDYLHEAVYDRIVSSADKLYSHADIAASAGASERQIAKIYEEDLLQKALL